jgi:hypothetical protein
MFITAPAFAYPPLVPFLAPGGAAWRAVQLSARFPWFIMTVEEHENGESIWSDLLVSSGEEVGIALESAQSNRVLAVHCMQPVRRRRASWRCRRVQRVWRGTVDELRHDIVFFEDRDGEFWEDPFGDAGTSISNRRMIADLTYGPGATNARPEGSAG